MLGLEYGEAFTFTFTPSHLVPYNSTGRVFWDIVKDYVIRPTPVWFNDNGVQAAMNDSAAVCASVPYGTMLMKQTKNKTD